MTVGKPLVSPLVAAGLGLAVSLSRAELAVAVIVASLPTAQNVFIHATRFAVQPDLARRVVIATTLACLPVLLTLHCFLA
ncbi:MAG: AEC family transporter [Buchananella hordeovulneris]|nr:AEC family transporter [Buchananella hordeovulneris]